ncbi:hypothetical protein BX600DRAFT_511161 [Xylariales sp. PMI_506]|nr:hypothetical protein BX600DRAFT_511161 [Xylariales sp. PMI_506]
MEHAYFTPTTGEPAWQSSEQLTQWSPANSDGVEPGYYQAPGGIYGDYYSVGYPTYQDPRLGYDEHNWDYKETDYPTPGSDANPLSYQYYQHQQQQAPPDDKPLALAASPATTFPCIVEGCDASPFQHKDDLKWHYENKHLASKTAPRQAVVGAFHCLVESCQAKPFRRKADLERHYNHKHVLPPGNYQSRSGGSSGNGILGVSKPEYPCDYSRCPRGAEPFRRLDHFRDHLRDYHREDLTRKGGSANNDAKWYEGRLVRLDWWRCTKCLERKKVSEGWQCAKCGTSCDLKRRQLRGYE